MANHVIRDRIWESRKIRSVSKAAALAYPWIFLVADDHGRFEYNPRRIWSLVFGNRDDVSLEEVTSWLDEYWRAGLLSRYHIDGDLAVWVGFKGRKASERRDSALQPPENHKPYTPEDLEAAREESRRGAENRGAPRQIDSRAEIDQIRDRAETERSNGDGARSQLSGVPQEQREEYARSVLEAFRVKVGHPETRDVPSQDWFTVKRWMDTGVPLRVVLRAIEETKRPPEQVRLLAYFDSSVQVEFERQQLAVSGTR